MTTEHQREQQERRETLQNDRKVREQGTTLSQFAQAEANEVGGRFSGHEKATVVGAQESPAYPAAPNWAFDPAGVEPALGIDINAIEPTGEPHEIAASIAAQNASTLEQPPPFSSAQGNSGDSAVAPPNNPLVGVEHAESPPFLKNEGED
jgi:hypothetical protein